MFVSCEGTEKSRVCVHRAQMFVSPRENRDVLCVCVKEFMSIDLRD